MEHSASHLAQDNDGSGEERRSTTITSDTALPPPTNISSKIYTYPKCQGRHLDGPVSEGHPNPTVTFAPFSDNTTRRQTKLSPKILEAMRGLNVAFTEDVATKVATEYSDMTPMERFLIETLKGYHPAVESNNVERNVDDAEVSTSSCRAVDGDGSDKE